MPDIFDTLGIPQGEAGATDITPPRAPLGPSDLGLPAAFSNVLGPSPQLPQAPTMPSLPPNVAQDPKQKLAMLATLGFMLGSGQQSGLAQGAAHGELTGLQNAQQLLTQRFHAQQQEADKQQALLVAQQAKAAADERQRQQNLMSALGTIKKRVDTLTDKKQYDTEIDGYASMLQQNGYRLDANWLRQAAPFVAPKASDLAAKAVKGFLTNPANKQLLEQHPEELSKVMLTFDRDGDGTPEQVPLTLAAQIAGTPFAMDSAGLMMTYPKGTTLDDKANADGMFQDLLAKAKAEGKDITNPQLRMDLRQQALEQAKKSDPVASEMAALRLADERRKNDPTGGLTEDGLDYAATQYRLLRSIPSVGRDNPLARTAIVNRAAEQAKALGQSPAQAFMQQALFKSDGDALTQMRKMSSSASAFENKAVAQAEIISDLSRKVPRANWPIINDAILSGKTRIAGDENATLLLNAITTFAAEYAKIIEGSTGSAAGSSDSARAASTKLISGAMNQRTFESVVNLMKREMRLTLQGYDATIEDITGRMSGTPRPPVQPPRNSGILSTDPNAGQPLRSPR